MMSHGVCPCSSTCVPASHLLRSSTSSIIIGAHRCWAPLPSASEGDVDEDDAEQIDAYLQEGLEASKSKALK